MTLWRLEGAALDPDDVAQDRDIDVDERVVVVGDLDSLMEVLRIPGFQLYRLQPDVDIPQPRETVDA